MSSFTYVAPFRFGRLTLTMLGVGVLAFLAGLLPGLPEDVTVVLLAVGVALPGTLLALYLPLILGGKPGLRVDADGIMFGGRPLIYARTSAFVPWSAISEIYLFRIHQGLFVTTYLGVQGVDGVAPLRPSMPASVAATFWHVPTEVVLASRPAFGWRLDKAALTTAVGYFASRVPVVDLTEAAPMQRQLRETPPTFGPPSA
ncbi:hypothetical protein [Catellatospora vulcania]|uniref:hypothetical protein n=1 Tax=Catellatospora vulcania TaxID=1460450 RepID=UPI0012D43DC4|nr:hypothetical protein [Catellatospora vulcania]